MNSFKMLFGSVRFYIHLGFVDFGLVLGGPSTCDSFVSEIKIYDFFLALNIYFGPSKYMSVTFRIWFGSGDSFLLWRDNELVFWHFQSLSQVFPRTSPRPMIHDDLKLIPCKIQVTSKIELQDKSRPVEFDKFLVKVMINLIKKKFGNNAR